MVTAQVWLYPGPAAWYFVTLPKKEADKIRDIYGMHAKGWGSLPITVTVGSTSWDTSIFPDKKTGSYLLPIKAQVRKAENISENDIITLSIEVLIK